MNDTTEEIKIKQQEFWLAKSEAERFVMGLKMMDDARVFVAAGILNESPSISNAELQAEIFRRIYRNDFSEHEMQTILNWIIKCNS